MTSNSALDTLKASVKVRGLEKPNAPLTPLREITGNLNSWQPVARTTNFGERVVVVFNLDSLNVVRTMVPYDQPVAQIEIMSSDKEDSNWGFFARSAARFIPENEEIDWLVGKTLHLKYTDQYDGSGIYLRRPDANGVWGDVLSDCWILEGVDGAGSTTAGTPAIVADPEASLDALMVGKTEGMEAQQALLADPSVNTSPTLPTEIVSGAFAQRMMDEGRVVVGPDGRYASTS